MMKTIITDVNVIIVKDVQIYYLVINIASIMFIIKLINKI